MTSPAPQPPPTPSGLLLIDKPRGPTSMDVCRRIRWRLVQAGAPKRIKVGHGGTLDPLATGLLVILVGKATPLCDTIMQGEKTYETQIDLSAFSTTDDLEGEKTPLENPRIPTEADIRAALTRFTGTIMQTPPIYSAMKVGGQRAYKLARQGQAVELTPRPITIHTLTLTAYTWPLLNLTITCGKGTYIRSLARDLGTSLNVAGHLTHLRRTRIGPHDIKDARPLDTLPDRLTQSDLLPTPRVTDEPRTK